MRTHCEFGHRLDAANVMRDDGRRCCVACRQYESTGVLSALQLAHAAYRAAPESRRDDMLVRDLVMALAGEVCEPPCTFVKAHRICGKPGRLVHGRALCDECAAEVAEARKRQGRDDAR